MYKKIELTEDQLSELAIYYRKTLSVIKTAKKFNLGKNKTRKILKEINALLTLSEYASLRTGKKNHFYGKKHKNEAKSKMSKCAQTRTEKRNPNYKHGNYIRRPRDFKIAEFKPIRNVVFNRDKYTCQISGTIGGHLHAHHLIPYWVCPEAFLDIDNLITVSKETHFDICHNGHWASFNVSLISNKLLQKYSLQRERLNELADFINRSEAIVRSTDI